MNKTPTAEKIVVRTSRGLTIAGTRITIYTIMDHLKADWPPHLIQDWYNLSDDQIQGVLDYIDTHKKEVEAEYQEVLADAEKIRQYWEERNRDRNANITNLPPPPGKETAWAKLQERKSRSNKE